MGFLDKVKNMFTEEVEVEEEKIQPVQDNKNEKYVKEEYNDATRCPECGAKLQFEGGCVICKGDETHSGCGWSKCD